MSRPSSSPDTRVPTNWAGNVTYRASEQRTPATIEELQDVVAGAERVKAVASRHTFNDSADTPGVQVRPDRLGFPIEVDAAARTVRVPAAMTHARLAEALHAQGWALPNLASLPHISTAGAIATGTHGSGDGVQNLAASVAGVELVDSTGALRRFARGGADFDGVPVHLGALGVITALTLDIVPTFEVAQRVFLDLPCDRWAADFDAITALGYSVSVFTTWRGPAADQLWVKSLAVSDEPAEAYGAVAADRPMHPLRAVAPANVNDQLGRPGPWHQRLPHFRPEFEPSGGSEIQSEFFVKRPDAPAAIEALRSIGDRIAPALQISEVRTMAADELWLSPAYDATGVGSVGFHFTWVNDQAAVDAHLPHVEEALSGFATRPHWGKAFRGVPRPIELYPQASRFVHLAERLDPRGAFRNDFLDRTIF